MSVKEPSARWTVTVNLSVFGGIRDNLFLGCSPFRRTTSLNSLYAGKDNKTAVLMIRLARMGARKQPYYRVVVIDKERARNGRSLEVVGLYNPRTSPATVDLKRERIEHWVSKGAQVSNTVEKLMSKAAPAGTAA